MMDWTDRHCRYFHRQITRGTRLYTEMVTTGALLHGDRARHLAFHVDEHPVALQLGGSEPDALAQCAKFAESWGYDEINLNCGCPSERVLRGAFGACLMREAELVRDSVAAMRAASSLPVTVKHRIGVDRTESYEFVRDFVGTVAEGGCGVFIVHARNAWLEGLSPKDNRTIPPLRHEFVHRLKREFPHLVIAINGGLKGDDEIARQLESVDGVMIGREAYHDPWSMADWDRRFLELEPAATSREDVEARMVDYFEVLHREGTPWPQASRHMLGLWNGEQGARRWRQVWSDHRLKTLAPREVAALATQARGQAQRAMAA